MRRRRPLQRGRGLRAATPLRRTGLRSTGPIKPRKPPQSPAERLGRRLVAARSQGLCELRLLPGCTWWATDWSHRIARGRGGPWAASNGLAACRACHDAITNTRGRRPRFEALGFICRTGAVTTAVPVFLHGVRPVLLDDVGGMADVERGAA